MAVSYTAPTFGPGKIFVKATDDHEWKELGTVKSDCLTVFEEAVDQPIRFKQVGTMSFPFTMKKRTRIRLLQMAGVLDKPKCTYKTIRRNCAKRNR